MNLDDGTDLTLSLVRAADGSYPLVYGTLVDAGRARPAHLDRGRVHVDVDRPLDEPDDRRHLPGGLDGHGSPAEDSTIDLTPTVAAAGAGHARDDGRRLLGGVAGRCRRRATGSRWGARPTWS